MKRESARFIAVIVAAAAAASAAAWLKPGKADCGDPKLCLLDKATTAEKTGPYDPRMSRVCEKSCAIKIKFNESELVPQPNVPPGGLTRCPVSGVVFRARKNGPSAAVKGSRYRFCCNSCASLFQQDPRRFVHPQS